MRRIGRRSRGSHAAGTRPAVRHFLPRPMVRQRKGRKRASGQRARVVPAEALAFYRWVRSPAPLGKTRPPEGIAYFRRNVAASKSNKLKTWGNCGGEILDEQASQVAYPALETASPEEAGKHGSPHLATYAPHESFPGQRARLSCPCSHTADQLAQHFLLLSSFPEWYTRRGGAGRQNRTRIRFHPAPSRILRGPGAENPPERDRPPRPHHPCVDLVVKSRGTRGLAADRRCVSDGHHTSCWIWKPFAPTRHTRTSRISLH